MPIFSTFFWNWEKVFHSSLARNASASATKISMWTSSSTITSSNALAHYSVLRENRKLFASRYKLVLPDEDELRREIERERRLIEGAMAVGPNRVEAKGRERRSKGGGHDAA